MIDYSRFNFITLKSFDKLAYVYPADGSNATFTATASGYAQTIVINHTAPAQFVPFIKYSFDGGATWFYNGDTSYYWFDYGGGYGAFVQNPYMVAKSSDTQVTITWGNGPTARTVLYKIYGIAKNV